MTHVRLSRRSLQILEGPGPLPKSYRQLSGFDKLPAEELRRYGWYPYEDRPAPVVDRRSHKLVTRLTIGDDGVARPEHEVVALSGGERHHLLAEGRRARLAALAAARWRHETAGIVFGGIPLHTGRESQATLALAALQGGAERWKGADGKWYDMDAERLQAAAQAVMAHKRACFAHEEALVQAIRAADSIESLDDIDLEAGWPSTLA